MFDWIFKKKVMKKALPVIEDFEAAGVIFTDERHVLAGWQPRKAQPRLTGIGGMRNPGEPYMETALREMVEELYGCAEVPVTLLATLQKIEPTRVFQSDKYVNVVYTFKDLSSMLECINKAGIKSYYYEKPPVNLTDLVMKRKKSKTAEVETLALLPVDMFKGGGIGPEFVADMEILKQYQ
jgi:hypothetical protein